MSNIARVPRLAQSRGAETRVSRVAAVAQSRVAENRVLE